MVRLTKHMRVTRRTTIAMAGVIATAFAGTARAQDETVRIGYAVSKTGQNAAGAGITTIPNYTLWVDDVNKAGGLTLPDGTQRLIEVVEYDDRSSSEEAVRAIERLATQDEVDLILPPWGTGFNLAIAPLMNRFGYPHLAVTAATDRAPELAARWDNSFWFLGGGKDYAESLAEVLTAAREANEINERIAMTSVADGFGIELVAAARPALEAAGFEIVYDTTYPLGTSDFSTIINEAMSADADTFVAFSYPPGTFGLTQASTVAGFNPKVMYLGVGVGFPIYPNVAGTDVDGVMSLGGIDPDSEAIQDYFARHEALTGALPDSWASTITYTSLEMLQQAIERVGLDREAIADELSTGTFETVIGEVKLENNQLRDLWWTGQWQDGRFVAIAPSEKAGASQPIVPKPAWKP